MYIVLQIVINILISSSLYALVAAGVSFLYATTKIFHLAHGAVAMIGGYACWWMFKVLGMNMFLAGLFAIIVSSIIAVLMNELVYEPLRKRGAKGLGYLIGTLALLMLSTGVLLALFGGRPRTFGIETTIFNLQGASITALQLIAILLAVFILIGLYALMKFTRFGKAMRATADNETVAEVLGVNTRTIRRIAFALSGVLAAAAGMIQGMELTLDPNRAVALAVFGFAAAVVGGIGTMRGVIAGSLLVGATEELVLWFIGGLWRNAAIFGLLFVFLLVRPSGIFGRPK